MTTLRPPNEMTAEPRAPLPPVKPGAQARLLASLGSGGLAGLVVGVLDARWAAQASPTAASFGAILAGTVGLVSCVALAVALAVGLASLLLHPATPPSISALRRVLACEEEPAGAYRLVVMPLGGLAAALWTAGAARAALALLAADISAPLTGVAVALFAVALGIVLSVLTHFAASLLAERVRPRVSPLWGGALGLVAFSSVIGYGVITGSVAGEGGWLGVFGVLKRPELDLRMPVALSAVALAAYLLPAAMVHLPRLAIGALVLASVGSFGVSATRGLASRQVALAVERDAPISRLALRPLRRLTDRDGDGASALFGGGDCDDHDRRVNPGAEDVPGNGIDEDCSGRDSERLELAPPPPAPPRDAAAWVATHLPKDLNVIVLMIDAWRWDTAGFMGYSRPVTPNLDALAKRSVVFERSYALSSYTGKSIPPMMIGKYGAETHRGWAHFNRIDERDTLLWERLQRAGVRTLSAQAYWYFYRKGIGFERGWDVLDSQASPGGGYVDKDTSVVSPAMADRSIAVLSDPGNTRGRFFFWNHWVDPHAEYMPHDGFDFGVKPRDRYDGEVAFVDQQIGRVLEFIERSDFAKRTAIIVTSDHGEAFGEHGMRYHGFEVWEPLVRVPLLIYVPGVSPRRIRQARGAIDLVPTVLDLMRVAHPSGEGTDFISGRSLLFDVLMPPGHVPEERIVLVDMQAGPNNTERQAFIEGGLKLIASAGAPFGLYDLERDPMEERDLLDDPALRERVVSRYRGFRKALREVSVKPVPR